MSTATKQAAERVAIYTTAPAAYDGFSTREESANCGRDGEKVIRRVTMLPRDYGWQTGRYASGSHFALTPDSFRQLVAAGVIAEGPPSESPALPADPIAAAAIELFRSVEAVNGGVWQVPHAAMRKLMQAVQAAGHPF